MAGDPEVGHAADAIENNASRPSSQRTQPPSAKAQENEANKALHESTIIVGSKPPKKATRAAAARETAPDNASNATTGEDTVEWRKMVEVVGVMCNEIKSLREIVIRQQETRSYKTFRTARSL